MWLSPLASDYGFAPLVDPERQTSELTRYHQPSNVSLPEAKHSLAAEHDTGRLSHRGCCKRNTEDPPSYQLRSLSFLSFVRCSGKSSRSSRSRFAQGSICRSCSSPNACCGHYPPLAAARMSPFTRSAQGLLRPVISAIGKTLPFFHELSTHNIHTLLNTVITVLRSD